VRAAGGEAVENTSDITTGAGTDAIVRDALDTWGRLDAIVNNAAAGGGTLPDEDMVRLTLGVHFVGTVNLVRSALPVFRDQRYGRIVNTGSGSVLGIPHTGIYAAGKGAVMAFSKVLANELRQEREREPDLDVTVNVIMPVAQTPIMPRVPDPEFQALLDSAFAPAGTSPLVAVFAHESCPVSGELVQIGGGRVARFVLATTEGWQAPGDAPTPEGILEHWDDVMANRDLAEPVGSMMDIFVRRGMHPYGVADIVQWARTGQDPATR
jgi:NAD(P)-dependent dehydrogenase (short-subunit alcohol dehydrogenase family)